MIFSIPLASKVETGTMTKTSQVYILMKYTFLKDNMRIYDISRHVTVLILFLPKILEASQKGGSHKMILGITLISSIIFGLNTPLVNRHVSSFSFHCVRKTSRLKLDLIFSRSLSSIFGFVSTMTSSI